MTSAPPLPVPSSVPSPDGRLRRLLRSPGIVAGLILSALWVISGGVARIATADIIVTRLVSFLGVGWVQTQEWLLPGLWTPLSLLAASAVLTTVTWFIAARGARRGNAFLVLWLAAILAGTVLGLSFDLTRVLTFIPDFGMRGLTEAVVESAPITTYWGAVVGWIPALIVSRRMKRDDFVTPRTLVSVGAVLVSIVVLVVVSFFGYEARQADVIRQNAEEQGLSAEDGAYPDPGAEGDPVPDTAPGAAEPDLEPGWCTSDNAMLLLGGADAATGHRIQVIHLMNFTDEPCMIEGYPDIAFADQNGNELNVSVARGSSFMSEDPGPTLITVPAQGQAKTTISWDANSTNGELVARQLYAASLAGLPRGSWPVELDVVEDSEVTISAWQVDTTAGSTP
ncbi:DUF4232 domain-containing protein [Microbacterium sp. MYb66]|uniref:DUF4232 domain-containing protein n=1 Tax=Microbacterium sp. MYb66 TaxID=1848692 RepID=UPI000CFFCA23|nr:DUF4232 domain-containing protein [Microbacterium sp. MYb66]PRA83418.1 hypothetical protein CQ045_03325 [Microbacterium sp. MYb66]